jgi:ABC transporter with metal-binding/Fe-S-binding domain ATP-binding protein
MFTEKIKHKDLSQNLAVLTSGGKDSLYSAYVMYKRGFDISHFLTIFPETEESYMFHYPNVKLTKLQAEAVSVQHFVSYSKGEKEKELEDLKFLISKVKGKVSGLVSGAIASEYQKKRVDAICRLIGIRSYAPLWNLNPKNLLHSMLKEKFEIIITSVAASGLDESWLGRKIDSKCIKDLIKLNEKFGIHLTGEGGEYETLVIDMPLFRKKLEIIDAEKIWEENSGSYIIRRARLVEKINIE